jgi:hypothetical protein
VPGCGRASQDLGQEGPGPFLLRPGQYLARRSGLHDHAVPLLSQGVATASIMVGGPALRVTAAVLRGALEAMTEIIRPSDLLPPLAMGRTAEALAAAEELRQRIPQEF